MKLSSPSIVRLPHASAGPLWSPQPAEAPHEWHEIETLLAAPASGARAMPGARRGVRSFTLVATALIIGGGVLAATLMAPRSDCGSTCNVVTADAPAPAAKSRAVDTAALAPAPDTHVTEGRSVAEPTTLDLTGPADSAAADAAAPEPMAPLVPHRHHHHHHHAQP